MGTCRASLWVLVCNVRRWNVSGSNQERVLGGASCRGSWVEPFTDDKEGSSMRTSWRAQLTWSCVDMCWTLCWINVTNKWSCSIQCYTPEAALQLRTDWDIRTKVGFKDGAARHQPWVSHFECSFLALLQHATKNNQISLGLSVCCLL